MNQKQALSVVEFWMMFSVLGMCIALLMALAVCYVAIHGAILRMPL